MTVPKFKPSQVMRLVKAGKMSDSIKGGHPKCLKCGVVDKVCGTESPMYWENGMYAYCDNCNETTLHGAVYPPCDGYPEGIEVVTFGERKQYPLTLDLAR